MASSTTGNPNNPWGPYDSYRDCSQGVCSVYCPQWCYVIFPPPPSFFLDEEDDSSSSDFSPLLIAIIGILASAFILVSYYTLISKYCRRRREGSSSFVSEAISRDRGIEAILNSNPTAVVVAGGGDGLDESLIKSIRVYEFRKGDGFIESSDCSVCLSEFQEEESLRLLPKCNHAFHLPCIDTWLKSHSNCPLCRAGVNADQPINQIVTESVENDSDLLHHHQRRDSDSESVVVVVSDLETRSRNETVTVPKPPEIQGSREGGGEEQVNRRSTARNSGGGVVLISDILREIEDEEAGVGTSRRVEEGDGEKTPPPPSSESATNQISSFLVRKFTLSDKGRNYRLPN